MNLNETVDNSFIQTSVRKAVKDAAGHKKVKSLFKTMTDLGGAGKYRIIFPIKDDDLIIAVSQVETINITNAQGKPVFQTVVFTPEMQKKRASLSENPVDITPLKEYARIARILKEGEMEYELAQLDKEFQQKKAAGQDVGEEEHILARKKIKDKYIYDPDAKNDTKADIITRLRDTLATICVVIKVDENGKLFKNAAGEPDMSKVAISFLSFSGKRLDDFNTILSMNGAINKEYNVLETQVLFKGGTPSEAKQIMKSVSFQAITNPSDRVIDENTVKTIMKDVPYDPEMIRNKIPALSSGWSLDDAMARLDEYFSRQSYLLKYAKTDTDTFKYNSSAIADYVGFKNVDAEVVKEAKRLKAENQGVTKEEVEKVEQATANVAKETDAETLNAIDDMQSLF